MLLPIALKQRETPRSIKIADAGNAGRARERRMWQEHVVEVVYVCGAWWDMQCLMNVFNAYGNSAFRPSRQVECVRPFLRICISATGEGIQQ